MCPSCHLGGPQDGGRGDGCVCCAGLPGGCYVTWLPSDRNPTPLAKTEEPGVVPGAGVTNDHTLGSLNQHACVLSLRRRSEFRIGLAAPKMSSGGSVGRDPGLFSVSSGHLYFWACGFFLRLPSTPAPPQAPSVCLQICLCRLLTGALGITFRAHLDNPEKCAHLRTFHLTISCKVPFAI